MIKNPVFCGACTAIVTPFNEHGIDYDRLSKNLDFQYENGVSAVVVSGTTGENATLSSNEFEELVRYTVRNVNGKMKVIAGVGGNNTSAVLRKAEDSKFLGADAILMVTPYYNKTSQSGLLDHFTFVADRVELPMILYNVPSRTGIGIELNTYKVLSQHPNINGVKEASGNISLAVNIHAACGESLNIWSGNDDCIIPMMSIGAKGIISVASNIVPSVICKLCSLCSNGEYKEANELYSKYANLLSCLFIETNPIPVKTAMKLLAVDSGIMRLPLTNMSEEHLSKLRTVMRDAGLNV